MAITKTSDGNTIEKIRDPVPMLSIEKKIARIVNAVQVNI